MDRFKRVVKQAAPRALKTIWWIFKITTVVSFIMFMLKYTGILTWIAAAVSPVFHIFGLPGDAALAYVSAYFINIYSGIAVISTLDLTVRQITILGTMNLAAHAMVAETAIQKKTGAPIAYVICIRTLASITLGVVMNLVLPGRPIFNAESINLAQVPFLNIQGDTSRCRADGYVCTNVRRLKAYRWRQPHSWHCTVQRNKQRHCPLFGFARQQKPVCCQIYAIDANRGGTQKGN